MKEIHLRLYLKKRGKSPAFLLYMNEQECCADCKTLYIGADAMNSAQLRQARKAAGWRFLPVDALCAII